MEGNISAEKIYNVKNRYKKFHIWLRDIQIIDVPFSVQDKKIILSKLYYAYNEGKFHEGCIEYMDYLQKNKHLSELHAIQLCETLVLCGDFVDAFRLILLLRKRQNCTDDFKDEVQAIFDFFSVFFTTFKCNPGYMPIYRFIKEMHGCKNDNGEFYDDAVLVSDFSALTAIRKHTYTKEQVANGVYADASIYDMISILVDFIRRNTMLVYHGGVYENRKTFQEIKNLNDDDKQLLVKTIIVNIINTSFYFDDETLRVLFSCLRELNMSNMVDLICANDDHNYCFEYSDSVKVHF